MSRVVAVIVCSAVITGVGPAPAGAKVRTVAPGATFEVPKSALVDQVRIKGGPVLKIRCLGDGCDWRRRGRSKILASVSDLDRVFRSKAGVPLLVRLERG